MCRPLQALVKIENLLLADFLFHGWINEELIAGLKVLPPQATMDIVSVILEGLSFCFLKDNGQNCPIVVGFWKTKVSR